MALSKKNAAQILNESGRHLALFGKFSVTENEEDRVKIYPTGELKKQNPLKFELRYNREQPLKIDGKQTFEAFQLYFPKDAPDGSSRLLISGTPLETALTKPGSTLAEVGGQLFGELLDALDALFPFWHPNFDRLLTEGFWYYTKDKIKNNAFYTDSERRELLYKPKINRSLLGYLRSGQSDSDSNFELFKNELKKEESQADLQKLISEKLEEYRKSLEEYRNSLEPYRKSLGTEKPPGTHSLEKDKDWKNFFEEYNIPKHTGKSLQELYRSFREAAEKVENISRCEPMIALIIAWYFKKLTDSDDTGDIAAQLYKEIYEKNTGWKPRLSPQNQDQDQETFAGTFNSRYQQVIEEEREKGGENSPRAILYKRFMRDMITHRSDTWKVSRRYDRAGLIQDTVRRFLTLAVETVEGVSELLEAGRKLLDELKPVYQDFEALYSAKSDTLEFKDIERLLDKLPTSFNDWKSKFPEDCKEKKGKELGDFFRKRFNEQTAEAEDEKVRNFLKEKGAKIEKDLSMIDSIYRSQLQAMLEQGSVRVAGGSLLGVRNPKNKETVFERGTQETYKKAVLRKGGRLPIAEPSSEPEKAENPFDGKNPPENITWDKSDKALVFQIDFKEEELKSQLKDIVAENILDEKLGLYAGEMDKNDQILERIKGELIQPEFFSQSAKATARAVLRSNLLGEFLLSAPGDLSPLEKKDTSLGVAILLEMAEKIGAQAKYEGKDRESLIRPETDVECGIRDVNLPGIWQITSGKDGEKQIEDLVAYWKQLANGVFSVREYIEDMKEANNLIELMKTCNGGYLTVVNETIEEHTERFEGDESIEMFNSADADGDIPPPSVVYLSNQAFKAHRHSLKTFEDGLLGQNENSALSQIKHGNTGKIISMPLFIGRKTEPCELPVITLDIFELYSLAVYLCDPKNAALKEELGENCKILKNATNTLLGKKNSKAELWQKYLTQEQNLSALLTNRILSHGLFQRCLDYKKAPDPRDAVFDAVDHIEKILGKIREKLMIPGDSNTLISMPSTKNSATAGKVVSLTVQGNTEPVKNLTDLFSRI